MQSLALALSLVLTQTQPLAVDSADAGSAVTATDAPATAAATAPVSDVPWWQRVTVSGFARIGVFYNFPFREAQLVGSNGGFRLADFRLGAEFHPVDKFSVTTSVELAAPLLNDLDPLSAKRVVDLRDAYLTYSVCEGFNVRVGQMRPGYYAENLMSDGAIPFISRSVLSTGLTPPDGYYRAPLAPDRQLGLQVFSKRLGSTIGVSYAVGVFNGNGFNLQFNDNNAVEPMGRVEVDVLQHVTLGLNAYYNVKSEGVRPNLLTSNHLGYGADLEAHGYGLSGLVAFLNRSSTFNYPGLQGENAMGVMAQVRYFHEATGLEAAARFAWFEPSSAQVQDQLSEIAALIGWKPFKLPFRLMAQFTHREEEAGVAYPNDSVDLMIHAVW